jgi:hypothetical protein
VPLRWLLLVDRNLSPSPSPTPTDNTESDDNLRSVLTAETGRLILLSVSESHMHFVSQIFFSAFVVSSTLLFTAAAALTIVLFCHHININALTD